MVQACHANMVAYTVFCHLNRHHDNQFASGWYNDYLAPGDSQGGPQAI